MDPLKLFKLPLSFAGSAKFYEDFLKLNKNVSNETVTDSSIIKYKITYKHINSLEVEVTITIQEDPSVILYIFNDKLITLPRLDNQDILIERKVMGRRDELYIIDVIQFQILLLKSLDI